MHLPLRRSAWLTALVFSQLAFSQVNRIKFNNQELFLNGADLAWVSFASDVGTGTTDSVTFANIMLAMHNSGGNAMRWWLHTNGTVSPAFNDTGLVVGPGAHTIQDMKKVLDLAWDREIGINLCLWSFDMLNSSNSATVLNRNELLLNDTNYARAYIDSCLIPMVDSLKGHPAILSWEIFNEPEGMSNEFGWSTTHHVPMSVIQRFINLCAGAIHRADSSALVTSGSWSFKALTDYTVAAALRKTSPGVSSLTLAQKETVTLQFNRKYRTSMSTDEVMSYLDHLATLSNKNYYSNSQLIAAGGDPNGTLDFYSVHYYSGIDPSNPTGISPFHHTAYTWGLDKPIVVAEFAMESGGGSPPGIAKADLFDTLYHLGYAGALAWSWTDPTISSSTDMLAGMQSMWNNHRSDIDVNGIGVDWPTVTITSPLNNAKYPDSTQLTINATVVDTLAVDSVEFFVSNTVKIGAVSVSSSVSSDTSRYTFLWKNIAPANYAITAAAVNSSGHRNVSGVVQIAIGTPPMTRLEAEKAIRKGSGMTVKSDPNASNGSYLDIATNDSTVAISWPIINVPADSIYPVAFGFRLNYASPKSQYINVNGVRADTITFSGSTTSWLEETIYVNLPKGSDTLQMQMFWGWMYLDYLAVPSGLVVTSVKSSSAAPAAYSLSQNYPNPFNPTTTIQFSLEKASNVKLTVFNILGQKVATLVNGIMQAGPQSVVFDASTMASGVYYYTLHAGSFTKTAKMMLIK